MLINIKDKFSREQISTLEVEAGSLLVDAIKQYYPSYQDLVSAPITVLVNDDIIIQTCWASWRINATDNVIFLREPKDPVTTFIVKAVATMAVNYLVSKAFAPKLDNYQTSAQGSSVYQSGRTTNSPRLGSPPAEIFGVFQNVPDLISAPYLYYHDNVQYRCILLGCGVGEYDFLKIKIADTDITRLPGIEHTIFNPGEDVTGHIAHKHIYTSAEVGGTSASEGLELESGGYESAENEMPTGLEYDFSGSTITAVEQVSDGIGGFTATPYSWPYAVDDFIKITSDFNSGVYKVSAVTADVITLNDDAGEPITFTDTVAIDAEIDQVNAIDEGDWIGPFLGCPEGVKTTNGEIDLIYRGGVGREDKKGNIQTITITSEIQWREYGTETWTSQIVTKTAATRDDQADTIPIDYGSAITPEIRMRRTSASSDSQTMRDSVQWQYLKSELPTASSYPRITVLAMRIKVDAGIAAQATNLIKTVQHRKLPVWDGSAWSEKTATADIAAAFAYVVRESKHPDSLFELTQLKTLHDIWHARGDEVNGAIDTRTTLLPALQRILQPGYADLHLRGGKIRITRDVAQAAWGQFFSETNTNSITEIGTGIGYNEFDGIRVEYTDPDTGLAAYVNCVLPENSGDNLQAARLLFCTSKLAAWRWGMRQAAMMEYITERYEVQTEFEGLNTEKGSKCSVMHHAAKVGVTVAYDAAERVIEVDQDIETDGESDYYVGLRKLDGRVSGPYPCTVISDRYIRVDGTDIDFVPKFDEPTDPPLYMLGTADNWAKPAIAQSIKPTGSGAAVVLSKYDERVYLYDDASLPDDV